MRVVYNFLGENVFISETVILAFIYFYYFPLLSVLQSYRTQPLFNSRNLIIALTYN